MSPRPPMRRAGWYALALSCIERIARRQRFMTSDDLWDELEARGRDCPGVIDYVSEDSDEVARIHKDDCCQRRLLEFTPPHYNGIGAVMTEAIKLRIIRPTNVSVQTTRLLGRRRRILVHESRLWTAPKDAESIEAYVQQRTDHGQTHLAVG